jgi:hypothetical protein
MREVLDLYDRIGKLTPERNALSEEVEQLRRERDGLLKQAPAHGR